MAERLTGHVRVTEGNTAYAWSCPVHGYLVNARTYRDDVLTNERLCPCEQPRGIGSRFPVTVNAQTTWHQP